MKCIFNEFLSYFGGKSLFYLFKWVTLHLNAEKTSEISLVTDSSRPLGQNCDVPDAANLNCV